MSNKENQSQALAASDPQDNQHKISLSAPWGDPFSQVGYFTPSTPEASTAMAEFVAERTRLHARYIIEQERTKRIWLVLSFLLIIVAAGMIIFAPPGREILSYWIGAALIIFAAGGAGYKRIWGKTKNISFGADQDRNTPSKS